MSDGSWSQTSPVQPSSKFVSTATAQGNSITPGPSAFQFRVNFTGLEDTTSNSDGTNGAHFFLDFFNTSGALVTRYEIKDIIQSGVQGTEITQIAVPLPAAVWGGLAMFVGMGAFLAKRRRDRNILA
jgi:hypothetical protein